MCHVGVMWHIFFLCGGGVKLQYIHGIFTVGLTDIFSFFLIFFRLSCS